MNDAKHDAGKILGCIVFALAAREFIHFIHRLIIGGTLLHLPLFELVALLLGLGLYHHQVVAWSALTATMVVCEVVVITVFVSIPIKTFLGMDVRPPDFGQTVGITTMKQFCVLLLMYGSLFAGVLYVLFREDTRREFGVVAVQKLNP